MSLLMDYSDHTSTLPSYVHFTYRIESYLGHCMFTKLFTIGSGNINVFSPGLRLEFSPKNLEYVLS